MDSKTISDDVAVETAITTVEPDAKDQKPWTNHPINIRLSLPFLGTRFYCTIVAGRERRPQERRQHERQNHPLITFGNTLFALGLTTMFMFIALVIFVAQSSIIEY
ncbi:MAG: hypothetical protein OQK24_13515 [Magnetovibrio sp.]|nr:hypothetical protein [Magnetovibrio sp.]